jgi:HEAT repeat protein
LNWLNHDANNSPDVLLPVDAADTLGKLALEPETVVPALTRALASSNPELRRSAARALGAFGSAAVSGVPVLIKVQESTNEWRPVRFEAGKALERITNALSVPVSG